MSSSTNGSVAPYRNDTPFSRMCPLTSSRLVGAPLASASARNDVGETVEMQSQEAKLDELADERVGAIGEGLPIGQERKQHADREALPRQNSAGRDVDDEHGLQPGDEALDQSLARSGSARPRYWH